jgi:hypothetical protein
MFSGFSAQIGARDREIAKHTSVVFRTILFVLTSSAIKILLAQLTPGRVKDFSSNPFAVAT